jgi:hypothetical protein
MKKFKCDICQKEYSEELQKLDYYGYNSNYGYCDNPKCKEIANEKLRDDAMYSIENGNFSDAMDIMGDGDFSELMI